jgi:hypothetical protein
LAEVTVTLPFVANDPRTIRIGLLGCGNVGAALVSLVERQAPAI